MTIGFNQVPSNLKVPGFYAEINASSGVYTQNLSALLIGQTINTQSVEPILIQSADQAKTLFGFGSQLALMIQEFFKVNSFTTLWALPLVDAVSSTAATGTLTLTGTPTENGTIHLYVAGDYIPVGVTSGDTVTAIATAIATACSVAHLPVITTNSAGVVTFTSRNKGVLGNAIDVRTNHLATTAGQKTPAGLTVAIVTLSGGAVDPTLNTAFTAIGDLPFEYFGNPYNDTTNLNNLTAFLEARWLPTKQLYGQGYSAIQGTFSALQTAGAARNDRFVSILGYTDSPIWSVVATAQYVALASYHFNIDPALGLQTLPIYSFVVPKPVSQLTLSNRNALLSSGITTINYDSGVARIDRAISTYQKNAYGQADASYLDMTTPATLSLITRELRNLVTSKFARMKLAADDTKFGAGQNIVTPKTVKAEIVSLYTDWVSRGLCQNIEGFKNELIVELDAVDPNRLNVLLPPSLINNLLIFATKVEFSLKF